MRIGPFIFTTVKQLEQNVLDLMIITRAPNDILVGWELLSRMISGRITLSTLVEIQREVDDQLNKQKEKENGSDPQSGEIATKS